MSAAGSDGPDVAVVIMEMQRPYQPDGFPKPSGFLDTDSAAQS